MIDESKKYVLLLVCLDTRAVTLEPLDFVETKDLSFAYRRFKARRVSSDQYYSDNAPQFKILEQLAQESSMKEINWKYIPVGASWLGGTYERLVSHVKQMMYRTFHGRSITSKQFRTVLFEIEATINSGPLTYVSSADDPAPLTSNDFLQMKYTNDERPLNASHDDTIGYKVLLAFTQQGRVLLEQF